jgi:hypothetical protein
MSQSERKPRHWTVSLGGIALASGMFVYEVSLSLRSARPDNAIDHGIVACAFLVFVVLYAIHFRYRNDPERYRQLFERKNGSIAQADAALSTSRVKTE